MALPIAFPSSSGGGSGGGKLAQAAVYAESGAVATGSTRLPVDDTIPQNTEGNALSALDCTITPTNANSKLLIIAAVNLNSPAATGTSAIALFVDSTADAIAVGFAQQSSVNSWSWVASIHILISAASTSSRIYKIRYGNDSGSNNTVNGGSSARLFGGVLKSSMTVLEILP